MPALINGTFNSMLLPIQLKVTNSEISGILKRLWGIKDRGLELTRVMIWTRSLTPEELILYTKEDSDQKVNKTGLLIDWANPDISNK